MKNIIVLFLFGILVLNVENLFAQDHNPNSVRPVAYSDMMMKRSLWFRLDFRQRINQPFHSLENEFARVVLEAVQQGRIKPYTSDNLETRMRLSELDRRMTLPKQASLEEMEQGKVAAQDAFDAWDNPDNARQGDEEENHNDFHFFDDTKYAPRQMFVIEFKQDLIFDKRQSRMVHDILAVTLILPAEVNPKGVDLPIATFSYKELVENVFRNNPKAIWFNAQNPAMHLNLEDAFNLRLFGEGAQLVKFENPYNRSFTQLYGNTKEALAKSQQYLYQLLDWESGLWEN